MAPKAVLPTPPCLLSIIFFLFLAVSEASVTFFVGGKINGWKPQSKQTLQRIHVLNTWATTQRFQVGDFLEWNLDPSDSVLEVSKEDYDACNTQNPLKRFFGGKVEAELNRPSSFFYISGDHDRCESGQSLHVVVLTPRTKPAAPDTGYVPAGPVLCQSCTPSMAGPIIASGSSSLVPTSDGAMQTGLLLFTVLALLSVRL